MKMILPGLVVLALGAGFSAALGAAPSFTMDQVLDYPFISETAGCEGGGHFAFARDLHGVRNVWVADAPGFAPRQVTQYRDDDGQEITQLTFSPDCKTLLYVRGGDHDANWDAPGGLAPDPDSSTDQPKVTIWSAQLAGGAPVKIAEGDAPTISVHGQLAFIADHKVFTAPLNGQGKPEQLFFDHGKDDSLAWSPDGTRLAFVSNREDHALIGIYTAKDTPLAWPAPSTDFAISPRWSPDGKEIAFVRRPGAGGPPRPILTHTPDPWSIWIADAKSGDGHLVWQSPNTLLGSFPDAPDEANLHWAAGNRIVFLADLDNWPHLYSIPAGGGTPLLLTPGPFMVENVVESHDRHFLYYGANTGTTKDDEDRRHVFRVPVDAATPTALTSGDGLEWSPAIADAGHVAFIDAGAKQPAGIGIVGSDRRRELNSGGVPADFPRDALIVPKYVSFKTTDGWTIHGQLFQRDDGAGAKPAVIFVHGGPSRQMVLGWHYMDYYANAYAVNQYLAAHGFVVLSVNYRLGIGYGHAFHFPDHAGPAGAAEYKDVLAGAKFLQGTKGVDVKRIGMWGGSYGGYLTALALARNSNIFKAGVDFHGVHDWSRLIIGRYGDPEEKRYEKGDLDEAIKVAFQSSPDADVAHWKSPVLLIQGDDDRNVPFQQTVDLARRLDAQHVNYEEMVIPNEIHGFERWISWERADNATAAYLARQFGVPQ